MSDDHPTPPPPEGPRNWQVGDIANGHVLTSGGWVPIATAPQIVINNVVGAQPYTVAVGPTGISTVEHILHLILTLSTLGLWGIVWIIRVIVAGNSRNQPHTNHIAFPTPLRPIQPVSPEKPTQPEPRSRG